MLQLLAYVVLFWVIMPVLFIYVGKFIVRYTVDAPALRVVRTTRMETRDNGLRPTSGR